MAFSLPYLFLFLFLSVSVFVSFSVFLASSICLCFFVLLVAVTPPISGSLLGWSITLVGDKGDGGVHGLIQSCGKEV